MSTPPDLGPLPEPLKPMEWQQFMWTAAQVEAERQRCREVAIRQCAKLCELISEDFQKREGLRFPELKTDAQEGAANCEQAILRLLPSAPTKDGG